MAAAAVTWIVDQNGRRWVPQQVRKRRKPARALRFADLKVGDVKHHTLTRLDSFIASSAGKRLTYRGLVA